MKPAWERASFVRYGSALLAVLAMAAARYALAPWLGVRAAYLPFAFVVLSVVLWCGPLPAALAAVLCLAFGLFFSSGQDWSVGGLLEAATFVVIAFGIILLGDVMNRSRRRVTESDRQATDVAEELNLLIDGAQGLAIYMLDPAGRVTIWNAGAERLKGWSEAEAVGRHTSMFYPAEAIAAGKPEADLERARTLGRLEAEDWRLRKDGTEFLASISMTALVDDAGELRGFAKIVSDITERRASETMIAERENHLRSILATVPDAMVVIDEGGAILSFSNTAQALFGYTETEVIGRDVSLLMPEPEREQYNRHLERYLRTGQAHIIGQARVVTARRKDGSVFPVELSIGEANGGAARTFTGFLRDLTQRQEAERRLQDMQAELIHVSRISAMGTMASTLAHELNQPIAAVVNYVEAVRDLLLNPAPDDLPMMREALDSAAKEGLRAGDIVRGLRNFVARGDVARTVELLPALVAEACMLGLLGAREKGVETVFVLDPLASPVFVDRIQIQQLLINLMRNACEAMECAPVRRLTIASRADESDYVLVTVSDTGSGIAPGVLDQLFTAFVSTKQEGMGLGLSICRTIVEANEGRIWAESAANGGTHFHFTLPRAYGDGDHD